jgi:hypothetical protein
MEARMTEKPATFKSGVELMGALMQQSQRDLAFTTSAIIANQERTIADLRALLFDIQDVIDGATVIDRKTEAKLALPLALIEVQRDLVAGQEALT